MVEKRVRIIAYLQVHIESTLLAFQFNLPLHAHRYWSKFHPNRVKWYVQLLSSILIKIVPANSYLVSFVWLDQKVEKWPHIARN